jgi:hypothetical protein
MVNPDKNEVFVDKLSNGAGKSWDGDNNSHYCGLFPETFHFDNGLNDHLFDIISGFRESE